MIADNNGNVFQNESITPIESGKLDLPVSTEDAPDHRTAVEGDVLFPEAYKTYTAFMEELTGEAVYEGLVACGMLGDKIPPVLTTESFYRHSKDKEHSYSSGRRGWVTYRYTRNVGRFREYGIPNPFAYELLARSIADNWDDIRTLLCENTSGHAYKVSRIHPRKQSNCASIFDMNYKQWWADSDPLPAILVGRRYAVSCDISRCFPSIYTHAIEWAISGREEAKKRKRNEITWASEIDGRASACTHGETHGLLIGPHASNLLAELILTDVDKALYAMEYRFVRNIDDYTCYTETRDAAERFVVDLERELARYRLSLNQQKTTIRELPYAVTEDWVHTLTGFRFSGSRRLTYKDVAAFLDTAVNQVEASGGNQSVLLYAMKMLSGKKLKSSARRYYADMASHLVCLYPYLVPWFEATVIEAVGMDGGRICAVARMLYRHAMTNRDYLTACYALYYATRFEFEIPVNACQIVESGDCLLKLFALLYSQAVADANLLAILMEHAKTLVGEGGGEEFDRNWLFLYEALPANELPSGEWREIKKANVSFVNRERIKRPDYTEKAAQAELDELLALERDDHGEEDPSEGGANEL